MINPILASSARRRMRSIRTPILITLYGAMILASGLGMAFGAFTSSTLSIFAMREGVTAYAAMLAIQFAMILLITPAMTAGSIAGERERQTLDMLLVTNTGSLRIVAGKLLESLGYVALLLVAALPTMCLTLITGRAEHRIIQSQNTVRTPENGLRKRAEDVPNRSPCK